MEKMAGPAAGRGECRGKAEKPVVARRVWRYRKILVRGVAGRGTVLVVADLQVGVVVFFYRAADVHGSEQREDEGLQ